MAGQGEEQESATNLSSLSPLSQAGALPPLSAPQASSGEVSEAGLGAPIDGNLKQKMIANSVGTTVLMYFGIRHDAEGTVRNKNRPA